MATADIAVVPQVELVETDGIPLESPWHLAAIILLIDTVRYHLRGRTDFFAGGNMFIYYSEEQARNKDYRGPDFFFVKDVDGLRPREWWAVWQEDGRYPDLILELLSPTTEETDRTTKKLLYERTFRTPEYFWYDPATQRLDGWRLNTRGRYEQIPPGRNGWLWSEQLQLWLGLWTGKYLEQDGTWPRFYDADGELVPTFAEAGAQLAQVERQRADLAEAKLAQLEAQQRLSQIPPPAE